jgi:hypothetical protein
MSANSSGNTYYVIETNVPQDEYQMGGFTIEIFGNYYDKNSKTKVDLGGYWNPESNGGFEGFEAHGTNPQYKPTIQVSRNSIGNTAFIISGVSWQYPIIVARDLWLGYNSTDGGSYGEGWSITGTNDVSSYSNRDTVVWRNAYSDSNPAGYITGYTETDTLSSVTGRGNSTTTALYLAGGSAEVPALHIRSGGSSWSEGLAIHPSTDSGYALSFYRTRAAYTDQTNTWAIGNLGDSNALNHFGLLRKGLTGGIADRPSDAIFTVSPTGTFKFGFNPYVGTNLIWHAGNDGTGSGLDADLLDGNHASAFATASHNHDSDYVNVSGDTMTGNFTLKYSTADSSDYNGLMFAPYSDEAGLNDYIIKAASDKGVFGRKSFGWHVHSESAFGIYSNGWVQLFGVEGGTGNTQVFGSLTVDGSITENSSIRYKKDIVDIEPASSKIELLRPVRYKKIKDESEEIGLIAEDVAELFPEVVKYDKEGRPDGVNYSRLSVILLKAVQELTERVNKLENK